MHFWCSTDIYIYTYYKIFAGCTTAYPLVKMQNLAPIFRGLMLSWPMITYIDSNLPLKIQQRLSNYHWSKKQLHESPLVPDPTLKYFTHVDDEISNLPSPEPKRNKVEDHIDPDDLCEIDRSIITGKKIKNLPFLPFCCVLITMGEQNSKPCPNNSTFSTTFFQFIRFGSYLGLSGVLNKDSKTFCWRSGFVLSNLEGGGNSDAVQTFL